LYPYDYFRQIADNRIIFKYLIRTAEQDSSPLNIHYMQEKLFMHYLKTYNMPMINYIIGLANNEKYGRFDLNQITQIFTNNIRNYRGDIQMFKFLIELGERPNYQPVNIHWDNEALFRYYWSKNDLVMINYLLGVGTDPTYGLVDIHVCDEILFRSTYRDQAMLKFLIEIGERPMYTQINIHVRNDEAMQYYVRCGDKQMVQYLTELGQKPGYVPYVSRYVDDITQSCIVI